MKLGLGPFRSREEANNPANAEIVVRWIGRDNRGLLGSEYLSLALEHGKHCLNLLRWERELRTGEHRRVFRDYRLRQARANKSLMGVTGGTLR